MKKNVITALLAGATMLTAGCSTFSELGHKDNELTGEYERNSMSEGLAIGALFGASAAAAVTTSGASIAYTALISTGLFGTLGYQSDLKDAQIKEELESLGILVEDKFDKVIITLKEDVTFDLQKTMLKNEFKPTLDGVALVLKEIEDKATYEVIGHADYTGADKLNDYLSEERAAVVTEYLIEQGVSPDRITNYYGLNAYEPKDYCLDLSCLRRVEIIVHKNDELIKID